MSGHQIPKKTYYLIFAVLMVLLALTVAVAYIDLGRTLNIVIAMTIAIIKATLVILYFMHVRYSSRLTWLFVGAGFFWFLILVGLTFSDYISRGWLPGGR
jgi:cytochrome c oxidase subunit 4